MESKVVDAMLQHFENNDVAAVLRCRSSVDAIVAATARSRLRINVSVALACCGFWDDAEKELSVIDSAEEAVVQAVQHNKRLIRHLSQVDTTSLPTVQLIQAMYTFTSSVPAVSTTLGPTKETLFSTRNDASVLLRKLRKLHERGFSLAGSLDQLTERSSEGNISTVAWNPQVFRRDVDAVVALLRQSWPASGESIASLLSKATRMDEAVLCFFCPDEESAIQSATDTTLEWLRMKQEGTKVTIRRSFVVEDVVHFYDEVSNEDALRCAHQFELDTDTAVEGGFGGVSNEVFGLFFADVVPRYMRGELKSNELRATIILTVRSLLEMRSFEPFIPPAHILFVLRGDITFRALLTTAEYMDAEVTHQLCKVTYDVDTFHSLVGLVGSSGPWLQERLHELVFEKYLQALEAMRQICSSVVSPLPPVVRCTAQTLTNRRHQLTGCAVVGQLEFRGWSAADSTPFFLCSWLHSTTESRRRRWLRFATSMTAIPPSGLQKRIVVFRSERLFAQTCFYQLDLPKFDSLEKFARTMELVVDSVEMDPLMVE